MSKLVKFKDQSMDFSYLKEEENIWVFGYGSLVWRPNFPYHKRIVGYVEGFDRRFWQGSTYHRGTPKRPGRVVTLVDNPAGRVWGLAYNVQGKENVASAICHLTKREQTLGCYDIKILNFISKKQQGKVQKPIPVIVYFATPKNDCWVGDAPTSVIAEEILRSSGATGPNVEYLFRLADFMRECVPEESEEHLFEVEKAVRNRLGLCTIHISSWIELQKRQTFITDLTTQHIEIIDNFSVNRKEVTVAAGSG